MQCPSQWVMERGRQGGGGGGSRLPNDDLPASATCSSGLQSTFLPPVSSGTTSSKMASDLLTADSAWPPSPLVPRSEYPCITVAPGVFYLLTNLLLLVFPYAIWLSALLPKLSFRKKTIELCHFALKPL